MLNGKPRRRIRIAHLGVSLTMGGAEKLLAEFARHADRERFDLRFISLGRKGPVAEEIETSGWPVTALNQPEGLRKWLIFQLAWLLRRQPVDVLHTHNTKALFYGAPAARMAQVPVLVHTRHGQRFGASQLHTSVFRMLTRLADRVVCVSRDSAGLSESEGIGRSRLCTIWNGIDVRRFTYSGPLPGGPAIMVGRLSQEKDVATLIRAAALARKAFPEFRLQIAGEGKCAADLQRLSSELELNGSIDFLGEVYNVPELLAKSSLLVLPSLTEGISLTLLEAMARGLPVVATQVGGNPEVVLDGETGYLVPARQPERLAACMIALLRNPARAAEMGRKARERVMHHFDVRNMVARYEALYCESLGQPADRHVKTTTCAGSCN
jgi:glycosyltransferase involved in cell wall biosynthesis